MSSNTFDANTLLLRHKDQGRATYERIISLLPTIYSKQSSEYILKGFIISLTMQSDCFAATAIAQLKLSESFDNGSDAILCDEFMECYHEHSALAALKVLEKEVCEKVERQQKDVKASQDMFSLHMRW